MLGDRFLKEADVGFTAEPYVSEGVALNPEDEVLVIMASDGLWDVVSQEKVATMAAKVATAAGTDGSCRSRETVAGPHHQQQQQQQEMVAEGCSSSSSSVVSPGKRSVAAAVADALMHAALTLRSKDDISIMVLHVLPADAAAARSNVQYRMSASGSM
jgi:serine/threonine protein phosphatase PrpC